MSYYKLVSLDIDGTLANDKKEITLTTINTIKDVYDKNVHVILSTGRPFIGIKNLLEKLDIHGLMITYNGGMVVDSFTHQIVYEKYFDTKTYIDLVTFSKENNLSTMIWSYDTLYVTKLDFYSNDYKSISKVSPILVDPLTLVDKVKVHKILFYDTLNKIEKIKSSLSQESNYDFFNSRPDFLEVVPKNVNKGASLSFICELLKIDKSHVIALGDGENDISMLQFAGLGVAMKNARQSVKDVSDAITDKTNNEDGAASYLKFIFDL